MCGWSIGEEGPLGRGEHREGGQVVGPRVRRWEFCECDSSPLQFIVIKLGICKKELDEQEKQSHGKKVHLQDCFRESKRPEMSTAVWGQ